LNRLFDALDDFDTTTFFLSFYSIQDERIIGKLFIMSNPA